MKRLGTTLIAASACLSLLTASATGQTVSTRSGPNAVDQGGLGLPLLLGPAAQRKATEEDLEILFRNYDPATPP